MFRFFIKNYSNILTVSKTSMNSITKLSEKKEFHIYIILLIKIILIFQGIFVVIKVIV